MGLTADQILQKKLLRTEKQEKQENEDQFIK